jgi:hypothetical protein
LIGIFLKEGKAWGDFIGYNNVIPPELISQTIDLLISEIHVIHLISGSNICVAGIRLKHIHFSSFVYLYQPDPSFGRQALLMQTTHP